MNNTDELKRLGQPMDENKSWGESMLRKVNK